MPRISDIALAVDGATVVGSGETIATGVTHDSRLVEPGFLFAALPGQKTDGSEYVEMAIDSGATAVLTRRRLDLPVAQIVVNDPRSALGPICAACYGYPGRNISIVGITGTNGKTTITYILEAALRSLGHPTGIMGTVDYRFEGRTWHAAHTTPEASVIQRVTRDMVDAGATHMVMEVSSHGLALGRLGGCEFDVVAFTNLTQDHLDFHRDMEDYAAAKMLLFTRCLDHRPDARVVVNMDDPFGHKIVERLQRPAITISCDPGSGADLRPASRPDYGIDGINARIMTPSGEVGLRSPLLGPHNLNNLLVALGICVQLGEDPADFMAGVAGFFAIPGRLERVNCLLGFTVLVDYAHTPDALRRVLAALAPLTSGRLMCVFGCGGDRDNTKRPLMGLAVSQGADMAMVTSDNPRTERPDSIIDMIIPGLIDGGMGEIGEGCLATADSGYAVQVDRALAIRSIVESARPGDTILIAGKGHEDYQILGTKKIHFDDREQAEAAIASVRDRR